MHISEGVPLLDSTLHQLMPRYDRNFEHLGYRYDPTRLKCRTIYFNGFGDADPGGEIVALNVWYSWPWGMRCVWPAAETPKYYDYSEGRRHWWKSEDSHPAPIDGFLPIVFNEYAEIIQINPAGSKRTALPDAPKKPHQPSHHHVGNVAFSHHLQPELGDRDFPSQAEEQGPVGSRSIWVYMTETGSRWVPGTAHLKTRLALIAFISKRRMATGLMHELSYRIAFV